MQAIGFNEAVELIRSRDPRYAEEAYAFLRDSLEAAVKRRRKARRDAPRDHSADELLEAFRLHALKELGPMAVTVLAFWGVRSCSDIGAMVFNLVDAGVFAKTDRDTPEAFDRGFDFDAALAAPFRPEPPRSSESAVAAVRPQQ